MHRVSAKFRSLRLVVDDISVTEKLNDIRAEPGLKLI